MNSRDKDFDWAVGLNRFALRMIGLWPDVDSRLKSGLIRKLHIFSCIGIMSSILVVPIVSSLKRVWGDIMLMLDNIQILMPVCTSVLKACVIYQRLDDLAIVVKMIENDWKKSKSPEEKGIMERRAGLARKILIFGYMLMVVSVSVLWMLPVLNIPIRTYTNLTDPRKPLLVQSYYYHDIKRNWEIHLTRLLQLFAIIICAFSYTGIDNFLGLLVLHMSGQLEILSYHWMRLTKCGQVRSNLKYGTQEHIRLIRFRNIVEKTYNLLLLGLLLYFGILFCMEGVLIVDMFKDGKNLPIGKLFWIVSYTLNTFMHMFIYCFVGEILMAQCEEIHKALFNCKWYCLDPKESKALILIMARSKKPLQITAGKMFPMTLETFCTLLKTSGSYISVLLAKY